MMAVHSHRNDDDQQSRPKRSVKFNLETGPVKDGISEETDSLRETAAMSGGARTVEQRTTGWLIITLVVLLLAAAAFGAWFIYSLFSQATDRVGTSSTRRPVRLVRAADVKPQNDQSHEIDIIRRRQ